MLLTKSFDANSKEQQGMATHARNADEVENVLTRQRVKRQSGFMCCCAPKLDEEEEEIPEAVTARSLEEAKPTRKSSLINWFADQGQSMRQSRASRMSRQSKGDGERRGSWAAWGSAKSKDVAVEGKVSAPATEGQEKV